MASLTETIRLDLTAAMKARDALRTGTLRMIQAALKNEQIDKGHDLSDEEVLPVLARAIFALIEGALRPAPDILAEPSVDLMLGANTFRHASQLSKSNRTVAGFESPRRPENLAG